MEKKYVVENMSCMHCVNKIESAIKKVKHANTTIDLENKQVTVVSKRNFNSADIIQKVEEAGYLIKEI